MVKENVERVAHLPQDGSVWAVVARRARLWITPKGKTPYRPYLIMVMDVSNDFIRLGKVVDEPPDADVLLSNLIYAMRNPVAGAGKRVRPSRILTDHPDLVQTLTEPLAKIGIQIGYEPEIPLINHAFREMGRHFHEDDDRPGLLTVPGVTPILIEELFSAAVYFHARAPWRFMDNMMAIEVHYPADGPPRYMAVMGAGGQEFGVTYYPTINDLRIQYSDLEAERAFEKMTAASLMFSEEMSLTFDDLEAIEQYGWPIVSSKAYPLLIKVFPPRKDIGVPDVAEIKLIAAALRVIPDFVSKNLMAEKGNPRPGRAAFSLPEVHGGVEIKLSFPVDYINSIH